MTVRDFSEKTGVPYRSVHEYLSGKRKPGAEHLENMARNGIDLEWLLIGTKRSSVTFDFTGYADDIKELSGIVAADDDLSQFFLKSAIELIDEWVMKNPNEVKDMGLFGLIASAISVWGAFSHAANEVEKYILDTRSKGSSANEVGGRLVAVLRPLLLERLKVKEPGHTTPIHTPE